ncbi:MAG: regulatory protein RecX [Eubacteriales bacterium]|nr:regulatory protein RecX [Eubacteriales bacterium]
MAITLEEQKNARRKAMLLLEHMDRTEKGLNDRLRQAGFSPEAVADAMDYVKSYGYINDARYAQNYISYRMNSKSRQKILQELQQKGIDRQTALEAWEEAAETEEPDECAVLRAAVEKRYRPGSELDEKEMRRLHGYLARRGFQFGDIIHVLEELNITQKKEYSEFE